MTTPTDTRIPCLMPGPCGFADKGFCPYCEAASPRIPPSVKTKICIEVCEGVKGARPDHPRLAKDVENAFYLAIRSPAFRALVWRLSQ